MKKTLIKSKIEGLENLEEHDIETLTDIVKSLHGILWADIYSVGYIS
jgi:hypothetical protein